MASKQPSKSPHRRRVSELEIRALREPRPPHAAGKPFGTLVGGWVCLDLVNTVVAWMPASKDAPDGIHDRPDGEKLVDYSALLRWATRARIVTQPSAARLAHAAESHPDEASAVLDRALRLRGALHRVFRARLQGRSAARDELDIVWGEVERLRRGEYLVENRDGTFEIAWTGQAEELDGILWPVPRSAVSLLNVRSRLDRLRQCEGDHCGWLFVDVSRGGKRRWCEMATCGNVAKVRAHRVRARARSRTAGIARPSPQ